MVFAGSEVTGAVRQQAVSLGHLFHKKKASCFTCEVILKTFTMKSFWYGYRVHRFKHVVLTLTLNTQKQPFLMPSKVQLLMPMTAGPFFRPL